MLSSELCHSSKLLRKIKESKKIDKYLDLVRGLKPVENEENGDTTCIRSCNGRRKLEEASEGTGYQRINRDRLDNSIVKIGKNTKESPGDLKRLGVI